MEEKKRKTRSAAGFKERSTTSDHFQKGEEDEGS
jgi:hypothetical protein